MSDRKGRKRTRETSKYDVNNPNTWTKSELQTKLQELGIQTPPKISKTVLVQMYKINRQDTTKAEVEKVRPGRRSTDSQTSAMSAGPSSSTHDTISFDVARKKKKEGPPTLNMKPKHHFKTEGESFIIKCNVIAQPPAFEISWSQDDGKCERSIAIDNDKYIGGLPEIPSLVIDEIEKDHDEGKFTCEAENSAGSGSNFAHLTISRKTSNTEKAPGAQDNSAAIKQAATDRHSLMVNTLSRTISPSSKCWIEFKQNLQGHLPPVLLESDSLHKLVKELLEQEIIRIGHYQVLYKAVYQVNKAAARIIEEAESDIEKIRCQIPGSTKDTDAKLFSRHRGEFNTELPQNCTRQITKKYPAANGRLTADGSAGSVKLEFTISAAKTPQQLSSLFLAETLRFKLATEQIILTDDSGKPLKHLESRLVIPTENPSELLIVRLSKGYYQFPEGKVGIVKCVVVSEAEIESIHWTREKDGKTDAIDIDNKNYFGGTTKCPSLAISEVTTNDRGMYFCRARNRAGGEESDSAFVEINSIDVEKFTSAVQQGNIEEIRKILENRDLDLFVNPMLIVAVYGTPEVVEYIEKSSAIQCNWNECLEEIKSGAFDGVLDEMKDRRPTPLYVATFLNKVATVQALVKYSDEKNIAYCMGNLHLQKSVEQVFMTECRERLKIEYPRLKPEVVAGHKKKSDGTLERVFVIYSKDIRPKDLEKEGIGLVMFRDTNTVSTEDFIASKSNHARKTISDRDRGRVRKAIEQNDKKLWSNYSNLNVIRFSSVRSKCDGKHIEPEVCIVLLCHTKGVIPLGEEEFPSRLAVSEDDYINTDVREGVCIFSGGYETMPSTSRHDYLKMGCHISSDIHDVQTFGGTIGPFVKYQGELSFLTNAHVLFPSINQKLDYIYDGKNNVSVMQPGTGSFAPSGKPCGLVKRAIFDPGLPTGIDVGVVTISDPERIPKRGRFALHHVYQCVQAGFDDLPEYNTGAILTDTNDFVNLLLYKFGSGTHLTKGFLVADCAQIRMNQGSRQEELGQSNTICLRNQYFVQGLGYQPFCGPGDSGAAVFAAKNHSLYCIGLVTGQTSNGNAIVTPIGPVLDALKADDCQTASFMP